MSRPAPAAPATADLETRQRLLHVAAERFADRGVDDVSIREICAAAGANVAAVNYYFRDKAGLYREVVEYAIALMQETTDLTQRAGDGGSAEARIRAFVRVFITRLSGSGRHPWIHRLMAREFEHPTGTLDLVMSRVVEPRMRYLMSLAAELMGLSPDDPRVRRSAVSLQSQCVAVVRHVPVDVARRWGLGDLDDAIEHIATFSIGGMRALAAASAGGGRRARAARPDGPRRRSPR